VRCRDAAPAGWGRAVAEAVAVTAASAAVALGFNAARPDGLPLVAHQPYETMVPCPEPGGPVAVLAADDPAIRSARTFVIDARSAKAYREGHLEGAVHVPYDWLEPLPEAELEDLARRIASSRATRVVVYGDGGRPDSGEHLGREISGRGIGNVCAVAGGAPALLAGEGP